MELKKLNKETSDNEVIVQYLRQISNCLAYLALQSESLKEKEKYKELIPILAKWGYDRNSIAALLQTTPESVSVRMSELKSKNKKSSKNEDKKRIE